jgi:uncharacterized protein DUF6188
MIKANKLLQVLVGKRVTQLTVDFGFTVLFWSPGYNAQIRIGQPFTFASHDGKTSRVEPGNVDTVCPALKIFDKDATSAAVENGALRIELDGGALLLVFPHPKYEAWELAASDGTKIVCTPGGELAVWSPLQRPAPCPELARLKARATQRRATSDYFRAHPEESLTARRALELCDEAQREFAEHVKSCPLCGGSASELT